MKYSLSLLCLVAATTQIQTQEIFHETLYPSWGQSFVVDQKEYEDKTDHQDLIVFSNEKFGTCLALDGAMQVTENDEFFYHESFVNIPFYTHGNVKSVLVIGGGDGGIIRELMRHKTIENVTLVELDEEVIVFSKKHLPFLSKGAFDDPRLTVIIQDGAQYIKKTEEMFDLILIDSPDPVGEALSLFSKDFYKDCQSHLNKGGIFVNQAGVPFMQSDELVMVNAGLKNTFSHVEYFFTTIPTYTGGQMAFGFASDTNHQIKMKDLKKRVRAEALKFSHYTPQVHKASFAPSQFIIDLLQDSVSKE